MAEVEVQGLKELKDIMDTFPGKVKKRAANAGISKAAGRMRTYLRRASPKRSGELRRSIGVGRSRRTGSAWVGLRKNYYYKRLEFDYDGTHAYFEKAIEKHSPEILQMIINETEKALYREAGKALARSKRRR